MYPSDKITAGISQIARLLSDPTKTEDVAKAHLLLGLEAEERQDWEDAAKNYLRIVELTPADDMLRYFGHNNCAYALLQLGRFNEAEAHCVEAIEVDDARHNAHKNLGLACEALGRAAEAAVCFINAGCRNAADKRAWLHLQQLLLKNPNLLAQAPDLAERMADLREFYEAHGGVPALN
jgi:tetratricopeptide (TPR) repeat protein